MAQQMKLSYQPLPAASGSREKQNTSVLDYQTTGIIEILPEGNLPKVQSNCQPPFRRKLVAP
jgi:hypothetical protein